MITIEKKTQLATDIEWLTRALSPDKDRLVLQYAYYHDGQMFATDGFRLHRLDLIIPDLEEGMVEVLKTKNGYILDNVKDKGAYPDIKNIVAVGSSSSVNEVPRAWSGIKDFQAYFDLVLFYLTIQQQQPINTKLLTDVLKGQEELKVFTGGKNKLIVFRDDSHFAMLMPITIKEPEVREEY